MKLEHARTPFTGVSQLVEEETGCLAVGRAPPRSGRPQCPRLVEKLLVPQEVDAVAEVHERGGRALEPGVNGRSDLWRARWPALLRLALQGLKVGADYRAREVLGHQVSGIGGPDDLVEREMTSPQPLLDPQLTHR